MNSYSLIYLTSFFYLIAVDRPRDNELNQLSQQSRHASISETPPYAEEEINNVNVDDAAGSFIDFLGVGGAAN